MICPGCSSELVERERFTIGAEEAQAFRVATAAEARDALFEGRGTAAERRLWAIVAREGVEMDGDWAMFECPAGCDYATVRLVEGGG